MPPMLRTGEIAASHDQAERRNRERLLGRADHRQIAVDAEQIDICVDVVIGGDGVENEVEAACVLFHLVGIPRDDDFIGAEAQRVFLLVRRRGEHNDVSAERMRKLYAHVAQPAETDDADLLPLADAPVAHRRVGGDPGAEQRRRPGEIEIRGTRRTKRSSTTMLSE